MPGQGGDVQHAGQAPPFLKHSVRRASGYFIATGPAGTEDEGETLSCVHCQMHWRVEPGSGRRRGWCMRCNGATCGKPECESTCVPFEKALEDQERQARNYEAVRRAAGLR